MKTKTVVQSTQSKGIAIGWFSKNGYVVSLPLSRHMDYDILVDKGRIQKVRIISTSYKNSYARWEVSLREMCASYSGESITKKFDPTRYDLIFMVCGNQDLFLFPSHEIKANTKIIPENYPTFRVC